MAKEGITGKDNIINHYKAICEIVDGDVSAEVIATDFNEMIKEGEVLAALHPQIVVNPQSNTVSGSHCQSARNSRFITC